MKTPISLFVFLIGLSSFASGQKHPDEILINNRELPKVLVVGTFHFGYPGMDAHKTAEADQVDILSPKKQKEVEALVDYIARFKPTKIVVEAGQNSGYLIRRYEEYLKDPSTLRRNEIDQVGFRLMKHFSLDTLYGCDAPGLIHSMEQHPDSTALNRFLSEVFEGYDWKSDDPMDALYEEFYDYDDQLTKEMPLLDYFKYLNADDLIRRYHGAYLIGDFKTDGYRGADALALYWYSRNLRIFRNIQRVIEGPADRVLVLFGAGHSSILLQQFEASPEFEVVKFNDLESMR